MRTGDRGFTLLEVMIATVMLVILAMTLAACLGAAVTADSVSRDTERSTLAVQQVIEGMMELDYGDALAQDGTAILTTQSISLKISATETIHGLMLVEVYACRPSTPQTLSTLASMTMAQVKALPAAAGSQVRVLTYYASLN